MKLYSNIIYNSMKLQKPNIQVFTQKPNTAESLQILMNPYLMGRSSITYKELLMVFTGTDPEYSVEAT